MQSRRMPFEEAIDDILPDLARIWPNFCLATACQLILRVLLQMAGQIIIGVVHMHKRSIDYDKVSAFTSVAE